jgi:hypothetical protein
MDLKGKHCPQNQTVAINYRLVDTLSGVALIRERQCNSGPTTREAMIQTDSAKLRFWRIRSNRTITSNPAEVKMVQYDIEIYTRTRKSHFNRTRLGRVQVWLSAT